MTDAEIREELARQIEDGERVVRVDSPADGPPLILKFSSRLSITAISNIRAAWEQAWKSNQIGPNIIMLDEGMQLFQLIDGRWQEIG